MYIGVDTGCVQEVVQEWVRGTYRGHMDTPWVRGLARYPYIRLYGPYTGIYGIPCIQGGQYAV